MRRFLGSLCVLWLASAWFATEAQDRRLAVAFRVDDRMTVSQLASALPAGWPSWDAQRTFSDGVLSVWVTERLTPSQAEDLFVVADRLLAAVPGLVACGELYPSRAGRVRIYPGLVLVSLSQETDEATVSRWALNAGLTVERFRRERLTMLLGAPLPAPDLLSLLQQVPQPASPGEPLFLQFGVSNPLTADEIGAYHELPAGRNELAVILDRAAPLDVHLQIVSNAGISVVATVDPDTDDAVQFMTFADETDLMSAQSALLGRRDVIRRVGPAIAKDPPAFLTGDIAIDFVSESSAETGELLLAGYDLVPIRPIPFLEHGYVYRRVVGGRTEPSYSLYDAARRVLDERLAILAVPDLVSRSTPLCCPLECGIGDDQWYLNAIRIADAWEKADEYPRETRVGLLDNGFDRQDLFCDEFAVAAMLDATECVPDPSSTDYCDLSSPPDRQCFVADPGDWCCATGEVPETDRCCGELPHMPDHPHAMHLASIITASDDRTGTACDNPLGVAPGTPLVNVGKTDDSPDLRIASAIWWLAGGDPWDSDYFPVTLEDPATVINLSFALTYSTTSSCATSTFCAAVCTTDPSTCSVVEAALEKVRAGDDLDPSAVLIREGGILVNAAVPHRGQTSSLHESPNTLAVATVRETEGAQPFDVDGNYYIDPSENIDIVAPMGGDLSINVEGITPGGNTSAAAAVVSGVAAMMFDVNPDLTAAQAECILIHTARTDLWEIADLEAWECLDSSGSNLCMGHGMVDACAAVQAALDCRPCTYTVFLLDMETGEELGSAEMPCDFSEGIGELFESDAYCPCTEAGAYVPEWVEVATASGTFCADCPPFREMEDGPPADDWIEKLGALLYCHRDGNCICSPIDPGCVGIELSNQVQDRDDLWIEFCRDTRCRKLIPEDPVWKVGETVRFPLPLDRDFLRLWGRPGSKPPEIRLWAGKERLRFDGSAYGRAVSENDTLDKKRGGQ